MGWESGAGLPVIAVVGAISRIAVAANVVLRRAVVPGGGLGAALPGVGIGVAPGGIVVVVAAVGTGAPVALNNGAVAAGVAVDVPVGQGGLGDTEECREEQCCLFHVCLLLGVAFHEGERL